MLGWIAWGPRKCSSEIPTFLTGQIMGSEVSREFPKAQLSGIRVLQYSYSEQPACWLCPSATLCLLDRWPA